MHATLEILGHDHGQIEPSIISLVMLVGDEVSMQVNNISPPPPLSFDQINEIHYSPIEDLISAFATLNIIDGFLSRLQGLEK